MHICMPTVFVQGNFKQRSFLFSGMTLKEVAEIIEMDLLI